MSDTKIAFNRAYAAIAILFLMMAQGSLAEEDDSLYQTSTIGALMQGVYDGTITFGELGERGDFGLGTVQALDGEMVAVDGRFYQVKSDGVAYSLSDSMITPFSVVTFFDAEETINLGGRYNLSELQGYLDNSLESDNLFYAIRIDGTFDYVKTRSVPAQEKPYPPLEEAIKGQEIFEFHDVEGTVVGFRCPDYVEGVNVPGYHLHFITLDRKAGGHLLDLELEDASAKVDSISGFEMDLPENEQFYQADLSDSQEEELERIESNPGE